VKLKRTIRELLRLENIPTYLAIAAAAAALLMPGIDPGPVILVVLGILAIDAVIERVAHFRRLHDDIEALGAELGHSIDALGRGPWLRPRSDSAFEDFGQYCEGAQEIVVSALSLGFACRERQYFLEERLKDGCDFKLLVVDPDLDDEAMKCIAVHDERGEGDGKEFADVLRDEIRHSHSVLAKMEKLEGRTGHLHLKVAKGLPAFTITMVNPRHKKGRMRVELRPYKLSQGRRPYFELHKDDKEERGWYDFFYERYYERLWNDSDRWLEF